ncbi:MAG: methionine--tRNA ligase, partial [Syntrophothermus sp.]
LREKKSLQFFDPKAKMFLPDRYVEGTCPNCGNEQARSDECENCGALYDPADLKNPKSKVTGETPELTETSHYYFPLGSYQSRLEEYVDKMNKQYGWKENVLQYCRGWFKDGLQDRAITRDLDWGVQVPLESAQGKVLYVWFEAVLGYISATKELSNLKGNKDLWKSYWQDPATKYVAFIGKDNVVFHTIIFPSMLMAWNDGNTDKFIMPQNVPANEFLNFEGKKFSKSRNWGIDVIDFLKLFPADPLRYNLAANLPENRDTDFYWKEFQLRNNSELADILGNFINRTFTFAHKHFEGKVPKLNNLRQIDEEMVKLIGEYPAKISALIERYKIKDAVNEIMNLARAGNKYFNDSEPWKTVKSDREQCANTIAICLNTINTLAELFYPVIPFSAEKLFKMLNSKSVDWDESGELNLEEGHQLNQPEILFAKIEDKTIEEQMASLGNPEEEQPAEKEMSKPAKEAAAEPVKAKESAPEAETMEEISIDDFKKIQLRTAVILEAERIPKSDRLLKLQVDLGTEKRQVLAGIAQNFEPEAIVGKRIIMVANLKPKKAMGHLSQGMILAVETEDGKLSLLEVPETVKPGTRAS